MLNKAQIIGNLGQDPKVRTLNNGDKVANLSVATTERWTDKATGGRQERTEWHKVTCFGHAAGFAEKFLTKGSRVYVEGKLQTRKWTDNSGVDHYSTEIHVSGFGGTLKGLDKKEERSETGGQRTMQEMQPASDDMDDSDIPF